MVGSWTLILSLFGISYGLGRWLLVPSWQGVDCDGFEVEVSAWLGWTTFPRTPFSLCFYLKWASGASLPKMWWLGRKQQSYCLCVWKVGAGGPGCSCLLWLLSWFISLARGSRWAPSRSAFLWRSCSCSDCWSRCAVSSVGRQPASADFSKTAGAGRDWPKFCLVLMGLRSSLSCGHQALASDK